MAIEVYNGSSWQDVDDPEICTSINPTTGAGTFTNIQRGEIYTGSGWEVFYIRSVGNGGTAAAPVIALSDKSSRRIRITVSHTNTSGDNVIVLAYIDDVNPPVFLSPISTQLHPNTGYTTTTYSGQIETFGTNTYNSALDEDTTYYIASVAQFYNSSNSLIKSVAGNTLTVTTHPYDQSAQPGSIEDYRTTTAISMLTTGNAYNNGTAWIRWQYQRRVADPVGGWVDLGTVDDSSNPLTDNETAEFKALLFESLSSTYEYQFRARVVYAGLGNSNSEVGAWSAYSAAVRPKRNVATQSGSQPFSDRTYFTDGSTGSASSAIDGTSYLTASNGSTDDQWISTNSQSTSVGPIAVDNISRDGTYTYYEKAAGYGLLSVSEAKVTGSSTLTVAAAYRYTYTQSSTRYTAIQSTTANDNVSYPFYVGDGVTISGSAAANIDGSRTVTSRKSSDNLRFVTSSATVTNAWNLDAMTLSGQTTNGGNVNLLNTAANTYEPASFVTGGTNSVRILNTDLAGSPSSTFTSSGSDASIWLTGVVAKGDGIETLLYNFVPAKTNARMISGTNRIKVTNGTNACDIAVYLNTTDLGTQSFAASQTKYFAIPTGTKYPDDGPDSNAFEVSVFATRVDTVVYGWLAAVAEVQLDYTYDVLT
jgi:hypothetical protein